MSIRDRIGTLEAKFRHASGWDAESLRQKFIDQLRELSDAELDRLEEITLRVIDLEGDDSFITAPAGCQHLRDFIAHVDADEAGYLAQFTGGRNV